MKKRVLALSLSVLFSAGLFKSVLAQTPNTAPNTASEGLQKWGQIYEVLSHPRCASCHVGADNRPRWAGAHYGVKPGEWKYHGMNVNGGESRIGIETLPCTTCHQEKNSDVMHGPPGAHVWALAPVEMEWLDKSSAYICQQIKDPARNGGRTIADVTAHIDNDELVHWGWEPGPGREPAPFGRKQTVALMKAWEAAGAPCPEEPTKRIEPLD